MTCKHQFIYMKEEHGQFQYIDIKDLTLDEQKEALATNLKDPPREILKKESNKWVFVCPKCGKIKKINVI